MTFWEAFLEATRSFCERHIIGDDPYQFENFTVEQLVSIYLAHGNSKVLHTEIRRRLGDPNLSSHDREILKVTGVK